MRMADKLDALQSSITGKLHTDHLHRAIYATDASVYREMPLAVCIPEDKEDLVRIIRWAHTHGVSIIPRAAGTSLAGQCVGDGLVVDLSRNFGNIIHIDKETAQITLQPGIIRDDLNKRLALEGLYFGPNTSTSNRCQIGGMIGNNSCGTSSIVYGSTRDKLLSCQVLLSNGELINCEKKSKQECLQIAQQDTQEAQIYSTLIALLSDTDLRREMREKFPKKQIHRRNTGYCLDILLSQWTQKDDPHLNLASLIAGSEGTLGLVVEANLALDPIPGRHRGMLALHFRSVYDSLKATQEVMKTNPFACELMDKTVLDCTDGHPKYAAYRDFLKGDPLALLMVEYRCHTETELTDMLARHKAHFNQSCETYHTTILRSTQVDKAMELRKAGLGLLANIPGDAKAIACIEDSAVALDDLPAYIADFTELMAKYDQKSVYYAHAGAGELHLRPILNLKKSEGVRDFQNISSDSAHLIKKYRGSLSGEHGDGRVRAPFIPSLYGPKIMEAFQQIKNSWDPKGILNRGKILDPKPLKSDLRYETDRSEPKIDSFFSFDSEGGILRMAEKCNGSGDCRKSALSAGTMCPSYHATKNEKDTTRARANILRELLTHPTAENPYDHREIKEALDLCLSCKACTSECPSRVNMTLLKSEWLYQYQKVHGFKRRSRAFAKNAKLLSTFSAIPKIYNTVTQMPWIQNLIKKQLGIHSSRSLPRLADTSLWRWYQKHYTAPNNPKKTVVLFLDSFTNYLDSRIGITTVKLLLRLNYAVKVYRHPESGRAALSKGFLEYARRCAEKNIEIFSPLVSQGTPLIGVEPSAILGFRDEYPRLVREEYRQRAENLAPNCLTIDEFLYQEVQEGGIAPSAFDENHRSIVLHGHCHQKSLSDIQKTAFILDLAAGHQVRLLDTGCCGMAGSFGYEEEHYEISMQVAETKLFPSLRDLKDDIICAPGTSCRHQIQDGLQKSAVHPVEVLYDALL